VSYAEAGILFYVNFRHQDPSLTKPPPPTNNKNMEGQNDGPQAKRSPLVCLAISCITLVVVGLAGGTAAYFLIIAPTTSAQNVTTSTNASREKGQVVVGGMDDGRNKLSSIELFPRPLSDSCSIPQLPQGRYGHSLSLLSGGRLVVCGGSGFDFDRFNYFDSCISWVAGNTSWTHFYTMSVARWGHTAWTPTSLPDSIVLLGGRDGGRASATKLTAETVPSGGSFELKHNGDDACGIHEAGNTFVLTGGNPAHKYVTRYNVNGFVEELPQLPENRAGHACAALPTTGAFVVAGGWDGSANHLSSVLTLLPGATEWTPLASLPRALSYAQASIVGGKLRMTGGYDGSYHGRSKVLEYRPSNQWVFIGDMEHARFNHATLSIGTEQLPCL